MEEKLNEILKTLANHERRIASIEGKKNTQEKVKPQTWYRPGSTIEKITMLINTGFFDEPKSVSEIVEELKTKDFHLKPSDLTLPLRKIVRKELLNRTKKKPDGSLSNKWLYIKA